MLFTSEEECRQARESFWLYRAREAVVSYGTATPPADAAGLRERFLASQPELRGKRVLLFLSRIQEKKGCDLLIEAFASVAEQEPALHLVMAGPDQILDDGRTDPAGGAGDEYTHDQSLQVSLQTYLCRKSILVK